MNVTDCDSVQLYYTRSGVLENPVRSFRKTIVSAVLFQYFPEGVVPSTSRIMVQLLIHFR